MIEKMKMQKDIKYSELSNDFFDDKAIWDDEGIAFIKHDIYEGKLMWMIYAADGERIAATDNRDFAFIVARQNNLLPLSAH